MEFLGTAAVQFQFHPERDVLPPCDLALTQQGQAMMPILPAIDWATPCIRVYS